MQLKCHHDSSLSFWPEQLALIGSKLWLNFFDFETSGAVGNVLGYLRLLFDAILHYSIFYAPSCS